MTTSYSSLVILWMNFQYASLLPARRKFSLCGSPPGKQPVSPPVLIKRHGVQRGVGISKSWVQFPLGCRWIRKLNIQPGACGPYRWTELNCTKLPEIKQELWLSTSLKWELIEVQGDNLSWIKVKKLPALGNTAPLIIWGRIIYVYICTSVINLPKWINLMAVHKWYWIQIALRD